MANDLISIPTAAKLLAVSSKQVYRLIEAKRLGPAPLIKRPGMKIARWLRRQQVETFIGKGRHEEEPTPVSTAELEACLFSVSPSGQGFFHSTRDRDWESVNAKTIGLKRPAKHKITALLTSEFFSRDQVFEIVERTIRSRDRAWREWALDPLVQVQQPDGPRPIHLHFTKGT
jgi:predicted DNA-binding transcriptional regulator AlpA